MPVALIATGTLLVVAAAAFSINAWVFDANTARGGHQLLHQAAVRQAAAQHTPAVCNSQSQSSQTSSSQSESGAVGVLHSPTIGLTAPVEQGLSDAVLAVAVGHDPASVWPGTRGTAVFAAHDVSYFVNTDRLSTGALLSYATPCVTYEFKVTGHKVVTEGSPVYNTPEPSMVLVTCWPTNALWFTPDRYLVTAIEVKAQRTVVEPAPRANALSYSPPAVRAPLALVSEGLTLATNSIPMGTMTIAGRPTRSWVQSPDPLDVEQSAVEAYIGGLKSAASDNTQWWHLIAGDVPVPPALVGATVANYQASLDVAITTEGNVPKSVALSTEVNLSGGPSPGVYAMTVNETVRGGSLSVTGWSATRE